MKNIFDPISAFANYDSDGLSVYSDENKPSWQFMIKWLLKNSFQWIVYIYLNIFELK